MASTDAALTESGRFGWRQVASRLGVDVRPGEGLVTLLLFTCFFLFITFQYTTKSVRQASFVDGLGATNLPWVYLGVALLSYPFLRVYSRFAGRVARHRLITATSAIIAASMFAFWWLFQYDFWLMPAVLYVWISIAYVMTVSQFWLFSNHVLDPRQAKRLFGFVGAGGLLGGVAGGQVARLVSNAMGTRTTFLVAAAILLSATALITLVHRLQGASEEPSVGTGHVEKADKAKGGFEVIGGSRHLQAISAVMVLTVVVAQIVDIQFNWSVEQAITGLDARTAFYGNFFSVMGISAFVFQLAFTSRIHRALGVGVALKVLPVTMAIGTVALFVAALMFPGILLTAAFMLKVGENGLRYSLDQATRELLFLPVPSAARVKAKAFIDVFVQRGAKGLAFLVLLPVTLGLMTVVQAGWMSFVLIAIWLGVTVWTYREYVQSFRGGLRQRTVDADMPINLSDVTTLEILVQSLGSSDERQVLHSLDILASNGRGNLVPPVLLYHDDAEVRRRTLTVLAEVDRKDAAPLVERRLGDPNPEVRAEAIRVLGSLRGEDLCAVMLPRISDADPGVRAAAVACLLNHGDEEMSARVQPALASLLSDASPAVRREAAKALAAVPEPRFQEQLIRLLTDRDPEVVREAITAVRQRVSRDGYNPLYVPPLVALLMERRVKHDAREALVAFDQEAVPALVHFMNDPDEPLWIRRALPKTIARIGTADAVQAILDSLDETTDAFLRRKLIESIGSLTGPARSLDPDRLATQIRHEARRYFRNLMDLSAIGLHDKGRLEGPTVKWNRDVLDPELIDRILAERMDEHLTNIFRLLALLHPPKDVWAAHQSLLSDRASLRTHALEYLDNTLAGELHQHVLMVIDDTPIGKKLAQAGKLYDLVQPSKTETMTAALTEPPRADADAAALMMAAVYTVYTEKLSDLYARVTALKNEASDPLVSETAGWVAQRLHLTGEA